MSAPPDQTPQENADEHSAQAMRAMAALAALFARQPCLVSLELGMAKDLVSWRSHSTGAMGWSQSAAERVDADCVASMPKIFHDVARVAVAPHGAPLRGAPIEISRSADRVDSAGVARQFGMPHIAALIEREALATASPESPPIPGAASKPRL